MKPTLRVLHVEDSERDQMLVERHLTRAGYDVTSERVETAEAMRGALSAQSWDVILCDYSMPQFNALAALALMREMELDIPFIIISGTVGEEVAVAAMKAGAQDYLMKDNLVRLVPTIERELREAEHRRARHQAEEQLRQAQKMEAVGQLAGGIAHDFNNLLTVINGYSELALMQLAPDAPLYHHLEEIRKAGERAGALTRQLLVFSRKQVLQTRILELNTIVTEMEKILRRVIGEDVELRTALASGLGNIKADPGQVEQVIMNLAVNARDAMPTGGKLIIETANVELDDTYAQYHLGIAPGAYVMLAVSDTGIGMEAEMQKRIFEPFFTTKESGTGLGLSTVYGIAQQVGGSVWVYSEPGRGTTFKVYWPLSGEGEPAYQSDAEVEEALRGTETILLTEDEETVRQLARTVLEMHGYHVLEAANGGAALLICEHHQGPIQLLLTDVVMPEMSGRELASRLEALYPEMRVLYMSGYTDDAIVHHRVLDSGLSFLQKPFAPQTLARKVREVLDK